MRVACERSNLGASIDRQDKIVAMALRDWLYTSIAPTQAARAKQMHMRNAEFALLYGIVVQMLARRYREACERHSDVLSGTRKRSPGVKWNYGLEKREPNEAQMTRVLPAMAMAAYKPHQLPILHLGCST
jgi:hypothetical protein